MIPLFRISSCGVKVLPKGGVIITRKLREYLLISVTIVGCGVVLMVMIKKWDQLNAVIADPVYIALLLLFIVTDLNRTPVGMGLTAGLGFAPVLCAFILFGGAAAVIANVLVMLTGLLIMRPVNTVLNNMSCSVISTYAAVSVARLIQEYPAKLVGSNTRVIESLVMYLTTYIFASALLVGIRVYPRRNKKDFVFTGMMQAVCKGLGFPWLSLQPSFIKHGVRLVLFIMYYRSLPLVYWSRLPGVGVTREKLFTCIKELPTLTRGWGLKNCSKGSPVLLGMF